MTNSEDMCLEDNETSHATQFQIIKINITVNYPIGPNCPCNKHLTMHILVLPQEPNQLARQGMHFSKAQIECERTR